MSDNRCHLEEKYTWDLDHHFATDADWETEYESTVQDLKKSSSFAGHLLTHPRICLRQQNFI